MGSSGWLSIKSLTTHDVQWWDYLIALAIGILFVIILYFVYKFLTSLETKPVALYGTHLIGREGTVYLIVEDEGECNKYIITVDNNIGTVEVSAKSVKKYSVGDKVKIFDYENAYYII
jgi:membrane protein implicated in regulation of membrane protease activity